MSKDMETSAYPKTGLGRYLARVKARLLKKPLCTTFIRADAQGITIEIAYVDRPTERTAAIRWSEFESIDMYKRDLFVVDLICMAIETKEGRSVELHEEMEGWGGFVDKLPTYLPGCMPHAEWWYSVAFPAFETNPQRIFKRDDAQLA